MSEPVEVPVAEPNGSEPVDKESTPKKPELFNGMLIIQSKANGYNIVCKRDTGGRPTVLEYVEKDKEAAFYRFQAMTTELFEDLVDRSDTNTGGEVEDFGM